MGFVSRLPGAPEGRDTGVLRVLQGLYVGFRGTLHRFVEGSIGLYDFLYGSSARDSIHRTVSSWF